MNFVSRNEIVISLSYSSLLAFTITLNRYIQEEKTLHEIQKPYISKHIRNHSVALNDSWGRFRKKLFWRSDFSQCTVRPSEQRHRGGLQSEPDRSGKRSGGKPFRRHHAIWL